jgi:hypothetical protein
LVLRGGQGTGKGTMICLFGEIFGQHYLQVTHSQHVVGQFNSHLKDCLILYADEAFYAGDKQHESVLKTLITEEMRLIEYKGKEKIVLPNYSRLMMSSNKEWVAPVDIDDRRFFILDVGKKHAKDNVYFSAIYDQMRNHGGKSALLYELLNRDLSKSNIKDIPQTQAILDNKLENLGTVGSWLYSVLLNDSLDLGLHPISTLYLQYCEFCGKERTEKQNGWSRRLKKFFPNLDFRQDSATGKRYYKFDELEQSRKIFERSINNEIDWED